MKLRSFGLSDIGKIRDTNEDHFLVDDRLGVYAVADGMGGHAAGEIASDIAITAVTEFLGRDGPVREDPAAAKRRLQEAVIEANRRICDSVRAHAERRGMGTTMVALVALADRAVIGHVGDSRAYLLRDGRLRLLTSDHSWVNEQVRMGLMSEAEAQRHPMRNIVTRALGSREEVHLEITEENLLKGDAFLLCSDGLNLMLDDDEIRAALAAHRDDPERACRTLVEAANSSGGQDNTTVVVLSVP